MKKVIRLFAVAALAFAMTACGGDKNESTDNGSNSNNNGNGSGNSTFVDLGLPSGTKWKNSIEDGFYTYAEAKQKYGDNLPTKDQWEELIDNCTIRLKPIERGWDMLAVGPNGNTLVIPLQGYWVSDDQITDVGNGGDYWSITMTTFDPDHAWGAHFVDGNTRVKDYAIFDNVKNNVRLVQNP